MRQGLKEIYTRHLAATLFSDYKSLLEREIVLEDVQLQHQWGTELIGGEIELKYQPKR